MNKCVYRLFAALLVSVVFCTPAAAGASLDEEITHLLNYIETSDWIFFWSNICHDPKEAVKHIEKKYNYLKKRIKNTEDFIKGAATGSSISGKPYMIICNGVEMPTADWLRIELKKYRAQ